MKRIPLPHPMVSATFLVAFIFFFFNAKLPFEDPDAPWHIAAGDEILRTHSIPTTDPWSFTAGNQTWYNISWLWDSALSVINTHLGLEGVFVFTVLMLSSILALLCYVLYQRQEVSEDPIKIATALAGLTLWDFTAPRPQLVSFLLTIIFHHCLHRSRAMSAQGLHWKESALLYLTLPLLMVIWVNNHGGFLIGGTVYAAYLIEAYLSKNWVWFKRILLSGGLCFAALFINPWGWEMSIATYRTLHSVITNSIQEWHPFGYGITLASSVLMISFILISNPANKHVPMADKILTFAWLLASLNAFRNFAPFVLLAAPYMAINLQYTITLKPLPDISGYIFRKRMAIFAAVLAVAFIIPPVSSFVRGEHFASKDIKTPEKEIAYIQKHYPKARFLNHYNIGGKLIYYGRDSIKIFIDGRAGTAYSEKLLKDYLAFMELKKRGQKVLDKYHIDGVIMPRDFKRANKLIADNYHLKEVYRGDLAVVYMRKKR